MKRIRVGFFGAGIRGRSLLGPFMKLNCDIVALCDNREGELEKTADAVGGNVALYRDFDSFIEHGMDAVVLANNFNEHAPYAIRCFEKGLHVFSECISNSTMAEGVELVRAYEKSNSIYMLAENYPQMLFNLEMKRVCDGGTLGKIIYAEGEYNHPVDPSDESFIRNYKYHDKHWRHFTPITYYVTHSLGPVMRVTGATPRRLTAVAAFAPIEGDYPIATYSGDQAAIITIQNDDGSIFRITGCSKFGGHHNSYRFCGTKGSIENLRGMDGQICLRYNSWDKPEGADEVSLYTPTWNDPDAEIIKDSGHGGGDFVTVRMFVNCIKEGKQPEHPFDIYSAVTMSSVAILGYRSVLAGGTPIDIPDFKSENERRAYENDRATPYWSEDGKAPTVPASSHPEYKPTEKQMELYKALTQKYNK